jgi:hypothetical protein
MNSSNVARGTTEQHQPDFSPQAGGVPSVRPMAGVERVFGAQQVQVHRDEAKVMQKLKVLASAAGGEWYYRFPVRKKMVDEATGRETWGTDFIEGPSIKLANDLCRIYGNCDVDTRVIDLGDSWLFYARFIDLESGYSLTRPFQQRKAQTSMNTKDPGRAQDIAFQIGCSKAIRNVAVNALQTFADFAFEEARDALVKKVGADLENWRRRTIEGIGKIPVDIKRVERVMGRASKDWLAPDVAKIISMMKAIADGMATADETFPDPNKPEPKPDQSGSGPATVDEKLDQFGAGTSGGEGEESPGATTHAHEADTADTQESVVRRAGEAAPGGASAPTPIDPDTYEQHARAIIDAAQDRASAAKLEPWWASDAERKLRNACHVDMTLFNQIKDLIGQKVAQFDKKK